MDERSNEIDVKSGDGDNPQIPYLINPPQKIVGTLQSYLKQNRRLNEKYLHYYFQGKFSQDRPSLNFFYTKYFSHKYFSCEGTPFKNLR